MTRVHTQPCHRHSTHPLFCLSLFCFFHLWNEGENTIFIIKSLTGWMDSKHGSDSKASACSAGDVGSSLGQGRVPEREMATHSSRLAWRIPGMGEPGGLLSMGATQSWTRLKRLSSSSSRLWPLQMFLHPTFSSRDQKRLEKYISHPPGQLCSHNTRVH